MRAIGRISVAVFAFGLTTIPFTGKVILGQLAATSGSMMRSCNADADALKSKRRSKKKEQSSTPAGAACLEVRESSLAIQESLQKFVREQRWEIGEEQISEDTWTFARYLKKTEVSEYTQPWKGTPIDWRSARMKINVRTTELPDGYTRTVVISRVQGYGDLEDQFATKRESWILQSNGTLESGLTAVLSRQLENSH